MRVEANVTSGLLTTDSSAVELVPLLQAEVKKLREMLLHQRVLPFDRGLGEWEERESRDFNESKVVEEMRVRVRELETQLAEREKLIDSLDMQRRVQLLEDEEEAERMFLMSEGKNSNDVKRGSVSKGKGRYNRDDRQVEDERDDDGFSYNDDPYNVCNRRIYNNNNDNNNNNHNNHNNNNNNNDKNNNNGNENNIDRKSVV